MASKRQLSFNPSLNGSSTILKCTGTHTIDGTLCHCIIIVNVILYM